MANTIGKNVEVEVKNGKMIITIDIAKRFGPSGSGKTTIVASTGGNVAVDGANGVVLGLNAYTKP